MKNIQFQEPRDGQRQRPKSFLNKGKAAIFAVHCIGLVAAFMLNSLMPVNALSIAMPLAIVFVFVILTMRRLTNRFSVEFTLTSCMIGILIAEGWARSNATALAIGITLLILQSAIAAWIPTKK